MKLEEVMEARNKALIAMDIDYFMRACPGAPRYQVEVAAHKARYECVQIPAEFRHASGAWLRERGYGRMTGEELLPEGQLPE